MNVKSQKWFTDQYRLYGLLNSLSASALKDLQYISDNDGLFDINLSDTEIEQRTIAIKEVREIFQQLDPQYTKVEV